MGLVELLQKEVSSEIKGITDNSANLLTDGEQKEFEELYLPISAKLLNYARKLAGDHHYAGDLVQETVRKAITAFPKYIRDKNFDAWITTILRNTYFDEQRYLSRHKTISLDSLGDTIASSEDDLPKEQLADSLGYLRKAVEKLDDKYRQIVSLCLYDELNYEAIGRILKIPFNTVKSRMASAKIRLAEILKQSQVYELMEERL